MLNRRVASAKTTSSPIPGLASDSSAQATREHRWRHKQHLLFACPCISGLGNVMAVDLLPA